MAQSKLNFPPIPRLRKLMEDRQVKREDLAQAIGVSSVAIGQYYNGETLPTIDKLIKIANYFKVSTDYLLGKTDVETTNITVRDICEYTGLSEEAVEMLHEFIDKDKNDEHPINIHEHLNSFITIVMPIVFMHFNDYVESCIACAYIEKKYQNSFLTRDPFTIKNGKARFVSFTVEEKNIREILKNEIKEKQDLYLFYTQKQFLSYVECYGKARNEVTTKANYEQHLEYCEKEGIKNPIIESVKKINMLMKNLEKNKDTKDIDNGNDK